jgi:hypothetical protein
MSKFCIHTWKKLHKTTRELERESLRDGYNIEVDVAAVILWYKMQYFRCSGASTLYSIHDHLVKAHSESSVQTNYLTCMWFQQSFLHLQKIISHPVCYYLAIFFQLLCCCNFFTVVLFCVLFATFKFLSLQSRTKTEY